MNFQKNLIIFEFANNHMGDIDLFKKMVDDYAIFPKTYEDWDFAVKIQYRDINSFIHKNFKGSAHKGVQRFESTSVPVRD